MPYERWPWTWTWARTPSCGGWRVYWKCGALCQRQMVAAVHQVSNQWYNALTGVSTVNGTAVSKGNGDGCLSMAIRMDNWKLIVGDPGDDRFVKWPEPDTARHAFGSSGGGEREPGTDHCRAPSGHTQGFNGTGDWLFDLSKDLNVSRAAVSPAQTQHAVV